MDPNDAGVSLKDLEIFAAVAETGGISAAARRLGASKAAVSASVSRLEDKLGVKLLQRSTRAITLTEAGLSALPYAQRAVLSARQACEAAQEGLSEPRGLLKLNAPMSFGLLYVVPAIAELSARYPGVSVDLVLDDRLLDLVEGGFDLALRIGTLPDSSLVARRLAEGRSALVASPGYLDRRGAPGHPRDLLAHDSLVYTLSPAPSRWRFVSGEETCEIEVSPKLRATSSLALQQWALAGLGVALLPEFIAAPDLSAGRLVRLLPNWRSPSQGLYALTTSRGPVPRKVSVFLEIFAERVRAPASG